jgi:hypothetical protein
MSAKQQPRRSPIYPAALVALLAFGVWTTVGVPLADRADPRSLAVRSALADGTLLLPVWIYFDGGWQESAFASAQGAGARRARDAAVAAVSAAGASVRHVSRWLGAVSALADSAAVAELARRPEVTGITRVRSLQPADGGERVGRAPDDRARCPGCASVRFPW